MLDLVSNQTVGEGTAITQVNAADGLDDFDVDGDALTYTCYYDTTVDAAVASTTACATLAGVSFTGATGVMGWTPSYTQSGVYEFKISGSDGSLSDTKIFTITVTNVDRASVLATISDQTVNEGVALSAVDANDGGDDLDVDGDTITYQCWYDTVQDAAVAESVACTSLTGVSFNTTTGVFSWTPNSSQAGNYEFKIKGTAGSLSDAKIFKVTVTEIILPITPDPKAGMDIVSGSVAGSNVTFTLTNSGNGASASLAAPVLAGANAANFQVTTNNCTGSLGPSATCTIIVRPLGSTDATFAATLTIGDGNVSSNVAAISGQRNDIVIF